MVERKSLENAIASAYQENWNTLLTGLSEGAGNALLSPISGARVEVGLVPGGRGQEFGVNLRGNSPTR